MLPESVAVVLAVLFFEARGTARFSLSLSCIFLILHRFLRKASMIITTRIATTQAVCMWIVISCPVADVAISITSYSPTCSRCLRQALRNQYICC